MPQAQSNFENGSFVYVTVRCDAYEHNGSEYYRGNNFYAPLTVRLFNDKASDKISFIVPKKKSEKPQQYVIYFGDRQSTQLPSMEKVVSLGEVAVRSTAHAVDPERAAYIVKQPGWQLLNTAEGGLYVSPNYTCESFPIPEGRRSEALKVLIIRDNGAGDIVMSLPTVRAIRKLLPNAELNYATRPYLMQLVELARYGNEPVVDKVLSIHDLDLTEYEYDLIINWSCAVENYSIDRNKGHRIDAFAKHVGLELENRELPEIEYWNQALVKQIAAEKEIDYSKTIAYVLRAASWVRTYDWINFLELTEHIQKILPDYKVLMINPEPIYLEFENIIDAGGKTESFLDAVDLASRCAAVITPDTGMVHGLQCSSYIPPTIVICGDIPPDVRFSTYENVHPLTPSPEVDCYPCWSWQAYFEDGKKKTCNFTRDNKCVNSIKPIDIANKVVEVLNA